MTNREKLIAELAALSADDFYTVLADNSLTMLIDDKHCDDCVNINGGCLSKADDECVITTEAWLEMPCRHAQLITTKGLKRRRT